MQSRRPTQKDIAAIAGVNPATVSMALNNHPHIPERTRNRIRKIAEELNYCPDPMLSALAAYRKRSRPVSFHGTLAWVANATKNGWLQNPHFARYYEGACQQAQRHGYRIEPFHLKEPGLSSRRLASIFHARSIRGLLFGPQPEPNAEIAFPFERFAAVAFGHGLARPLLHSVATAHFRATVQVIERLKALGYRRIAHTMTAFQDRKVGYHCLAGYLLEQFLSRDELIVPSVDLDYDPPAFQRWFKKTKPDAIVTGNLRILPMLEKLGLRVPDDVGVACPCLPCGEGVLSGISEDAVNIGRVAVDTLVALLLSDECGVPAQPRKVLVEGSWIEGGTVVRQPGATCPAGVDSEKREGI
ncbi:MAG TPA: LacI family DNA-binding transcriptional regulator [Chthoniobacteraceae bacterium]|nr:LacI family DNA-binding transcriptional regulator [Chthoniobacteraceae bacterium]